MEEGKAKKVKGHHSSKVGLPVYEKADHYKDKGNEKETLQELRMLSTVTLDCQVTKIVMNSQL